jgi:hypothetical protein
MAMHAGLPQVAVVTATFLKCISFKILMAVRGKVVLLEKV